MRANQMLHFKCHSCGRSSVIQGVANNERVQFVCDNCGYMANFSVKHIRKSQGAKAFTQHE